MISKIVDDLKTWIFPNPFQEAHIVHQEAQLSPIPISPIAPNVNPKRPKKVLPESKFNLQGLKTNPQGPRLKSKRFKFDNKRLRGSKIDSHMPEIQSQKPNIDSLNSKVDYNWLKL